MTVTVESYAHAAWMLDCEVAAIRAVAEVESAGSGFVAVVDDAGSHQAPRILYEAHVFHRLTGGKFDGKLFVLPLFKSETMKGTLWQRQVSLPQWDQRSYGREAFQHVKLAQAAKLDREAALMSCSWGLFQIMGENFKRAGFSSVQEMVNAAYKDEDAHLRMFVNFIKSNADLTRALQVVPPLKKPDFATFKRLYNGTGANDYAARMAAAYARFSKEA